MFRRSKEIVFSPHGRRRSRRPPAWLLWTLAGLAAGAGGVLYVQERLLPPRLSVADSSRISQRYTQAQADRVRLSAQLEAAGVQLAALQADRDGLDRALAASRVAVGQLQGDLDSVVESLPADPRKSQVEVRAARFASSAGMLDYNLVLTRERGGAHPLKGTVQLVVKGASPQRADASVNLKPIALSLGRQQVLRGSVPLPEGFRPRQTTVQVLDRDASSVLGMRILVLR